MSLDITEHRWWLTYDLACAEEDCEEGDAHDDGLPLPLAVAADDGGHDVDEAHVGGEVDDAEEALELLQGHDDGGAAHEPGERGFGEEVDDEPQAEEPQRRLEEAGEEGGGEGQLQVQDGLLLRRHRFPEHGPHHQRRDRHRAHRQVPRAPQQRVDQRWHEARICMPTISSISHKFLAMND